MCEIRSCDIHHYPENEDLCIENYSITSFEYCLLYSIYIVIFTWGSVILSSGLLSAQKMSQAHL